MAVANPPRHVLVQPALPSLPEGDWPRRGEWAYDDYVRLPNVPGVPFEVIYGVLYTSNTPEIPRLPPVAPTERGRPTR